MPVDPPLLDAPAIFAILDAHQVQYVVVGGYAAQIHGSSRVTTDVDVTPDRSPANLERLAQALRHLGGGIRVGDLDEGLPFDTSADVLIGVKTLNLRTPHGDIDLTFEPDGTNGYPDLIRAAQDHTIGAIHVHIAALADIIRSKTPAGRQKDLLALPELHTLAKAQRTTHPTDESPGSRQTFTAGPDPRRTRSCSPSMATLDTAERPAHPACADGASPPRLPDLYLRERSPARAR